VHSNYNPRHFPPSWQHHYMMWEQLYKCLVKPEQEYRTMMFQNTKRWLSSVKKLIPLVNLLHHRHAQHALLEFNTLLEHHLKHYGEKHTLKLFKLYRLVIQQNALGQVVSEIPFCKTDRDGFPKVLKPWKVSKDSPVYDIRWIMSYWRIIEVFRIKPEYNISTITTKPRVDTNLLEDIQQFITDWPLILKLNKKIKRTAYS
jgi:hypothetical protein